MGSHDPDRGGQLRSSAFLLWKHVFILTSAQKLQSSEEEKVKGQTRSPQFVDHLPSAGVFRHRGSFDDVRFVAEASSRVTLRFTPWVCCGALTPVG